MGNTLLGAIVASSLMITSAAAWEINEAVQTTLVSAAQTSASSINLVVRRDGQENRRSLDMSGQVTLTCIKTRKDAQLEGQPIKAGIALGLTVKDETGANLKILSALSRRDARAKKSFEISNDNTASALKFNVAQIERRDTFATVSFTSEFLFMFRDKRGGLGIDFLDLVASANQTINAKILLQEGWDFESAGLKILIDARGSKTTVQELEKRCAS